MRDDFLKWKAEYCLQTGVDLLLVFPGEHEAEVLLNKPEGRLIHSLLFFKYFSFLGGGIYSS